MMDHLAEFQVLLGKLMSPDNDVRKQSEEAYDQIPKEQRASLLFVTSKNTEYNVENRQFALVLLRRLFSNDFKEIWDALTPETQSTFCAEVLVSTQNEHDENLRKRFCDLVAEIARNLIDEEANQTWQDVLRVLFTWASSDDPRLRETGLSLVENVPNIFGRQQSEYLTTIRDMLAANLQYTSPGGDDAAASKVRVAAVKAITAFICDNEDDQVLLRQLQPLIIHVLHVCAHTIQTEDDDSSLQCLGEIASTSPKILRQNLAELCTMCLGAVANADLEDSFRHSALEVLIGLAETNPPMMRKDGKRFVPDIVKQCLALMVDLEDDPEWAEKDEQNDEDEGDSNATIGETSLDRIACALGGKSILPQCLTLVPPMLQHADWKFRYAGLMALSSIGEGCVKQMETILEQIIDSILPYLQDPHPRVRYAACNALGQMSSDFAPKLQKQLCHKVIPALLAVLNDLSNARVAAHSGAALVNFSEDAPKSVMTTYLDPIMQKLEWVLEHTFKQLVEKGKKVVLEQIVTTIASVADSAEANFAPYYDRVMPCLKYIVENAVQPELRLLRGKTVECVSLIGLAVGKEKFLPDAGAVMQLLLKTQTEFGDQQEGDDPQVSYLMSAWARVCTILKSDFVQYLPLVMPSVMKAASFKPEVAVVECEDAEHIESEDDDWQFVNLGDQQRLGIKTAGLEDKATACQMLVCYARELKAGFAEYVQPTTELLVPLLKFYFHDGVRTAAAEALPELLECAKVKGPAFVAEMWRYIYPELLKAIELEVEDEVLPEMMYSMAKCIECLGHGYLTDKEFQEIVEVLSKRFATHFEKASQREELRKDEDYDEELEKDLIDENDDDAFLLSKISDILHACFGTYKEAVLPYFEKLLPQLVQLLEPSRPHSDLQWAICIFDDVIEFGGMGSLKYQQYFLPAMVNGLKHQAPEVRQAAAYGFGVMAMFGGMAYAQTCAEAIPYLTTMIEQPGSRTGDPSVEATENAIAAVAKILKYNNSMVDLPRVLPVFISWLPVWDDKEECPHVYGYFCDLIENNHPIVMGENNVNLPHIISIIVEAFKRDAFSDDEKCVETAARLRVILRHVQSNEALFQACVAALSEEQRHVLQQQLAL